MTTISKGDMSVLGKAFLMAVMLLFMAMSGAAGYYQGRKEGRAEACVGCPQKCQDCLGCEKKN